MNFLTPAAFALGLLLPVIVALYLLKLRRTEREIASTYLWRKMIRDVEANAPWQKLKPNLLLFLQLLFLALLILAIARPFTFAEDNIAQNLILILDSSASMAANDVQPSRLEAAKNRAVQRVNEAPENSRVTVIEAGREARLRVSAGQDRRQIYQAISEIQPGTGGSRLGLALELASAIAGRQPGTDIVVLSDGRGTLPDALRLHGRLRFIPIGLSGENQAISQLNLEYPPGGGAQAFVQVSNYGSQPARRRLAILADGRMSSAYDLDLPAGGSQSVIVPDLPTAALEISAQLEGSDPLAIDDHALAMVRRPAPVRAALVSSGSLFLRTALKLLPNLELVEVQPGADLPDGSYDLVIYDRSVPAALPPQAPLFFIAPPKSTPLFSVTGQVEAPAARVVDPSAPLLRSVALAGVSILDSPAISLPAWAETAIAGDLPDGSSVPLLMYGEQNRRRVAILAFDLAHSDFALNIAFPITLANTLSWLVPANTGALPVALPPGEPLSINLPAGITQATLTPPGGAPLTLQSGDGRLTFTATERLGRYALQWSGGQPAYFAVNLFSPPESAIAPADSLSGVTPIDDPAATRAEPGQREGWRWPAAIALLFLVIEWLVYQRAALSKLFNRSN